MTDVDVLTPREVPLGGPRAMRVRRTLPQRHRSLIGAWCFVDHYGPDEVDQTGGMVLPAHPHTGLQTASWLFDGEIEHRDSVGSRATVRPGELNLMTAGRGISHTEVSTPDTTVLHGAQLWIALPDGSRDTEPRFEHFAPEPVRGPGWEARVFIGSLLGASSPVHDPHPAPRRRADARRRQEPRGRGRRDLRARRAPRRRRRSSVDGTELKPSDLGLRRRRAAATLDHRPRTRRPGCSLLGGPPFGEAIVMWWNFIGRTHEEIVGFREEWQAQIRRRRGRRRRPQVADGRFGVVDLDLQPIPAPALPNVRLKLRH